MPKVIDIRDTDTTTVQEIIVTDELRLIGFHQRHYNCFELSYDDGYRRLAYALKRLTI
ncbi:hypothetical protein VPHD249_0218 [Vibrio phage D249]|nr:hypothetical protein SIPHO036v1_20016 [Vibrio phage 70E38.1]QZI87913.1 hypothetical protein SIPHO041v1_p0002 [Vibrio phage 234P1]QZI88268.1 hypothetical protein SIPHO035v1_p0177 [Vibrio phage 234P7B]QZI88446.1 hypothetical protein SIPHO037v1_p0005 [Vibrio phage 70E35.2]QZI88634.1 hypothetical protein SIPHO039v1_p0005 [Vibrio phage 70E35.5a]QZI88818.1 hypothetical protein SIPHO040v1_p0005 [Vibrio phage 70E35.6]QZI89020.1 hypothetical protein SIPHO042v1_p0023 [Vibrio phage 70E37.1]QZI89266.